jgi:hypothetical protein
VDADPERGVPVAFGADDEGLAEVDAAELPAAGGVVLLLLAHAVRPSSTMAATPSRVVVRTVVLTTGTHFLIPPRSRSARRCQRNYCASSPNRTDRPVGMVAGSAESTGNLR